MSAEPPFNRIGWFFDRPSWNEPLSGYAGADQLLKKFADTAVSFTEESDAAIDPSLSPDDPPIVRLVQLMVDEAIQEGATKIELRLTENALAVIYHFADGRSWNRDSPPVRLLTPILNRLISVFGNGQPFQHVSGATVTCEFVPNSLGAVLEISAP